MANEVEHQLQQLNALPDDDFWEKYLPAEGIDSLDHSSWNTISKPDFARCFRLVELTSSEVYKTSVFGWRPRAKRAEMRKNGMRYLLVRPESLDSTDAIAFLSFLPVEEQSPQTTAPFIALYVYEVHVDPSCQSKGLGKRLMRVAEGIAARIGARKVMLTVFEENEGGRRFYDREGYAVDEVSPSAEEIAEMKREVLASRAGGGVTRRLRCRDGNENEKKPLNEEKEENIGGYFIMSKTIKEHG